MVVFLNSFSCATPVTEPLLNTGSNSVGIIVYTGQRPPLLYCTCVHKEVFLDLVRNVLLHLLRLKIIFLRKMILWDEMNV